MINYRKTKDLFVGTINGEPFNAPATDKFAAALKKVEGGKMTPAAFKKLIKAGHSTEVAGSNKYLKYNPVTKQYFLTLDGKKKTSKHPIPENLVRYIEDSYDKDIDFMPIVKAWARLLSNPRYTPLMGEYFDTYINTVYVDHKLASKLEKEEGLTSQAAEAAATYQDISITQEGLLATYKVAEIVRWKYTVEQDKKTKTWKRVKVPMDTTKPLIDPVTGAVKKKAKVVKPKFAEEVLYTPYIMKSGDLFYSKDILGYIYKIGEQQWLPEGAQRNLDHTSGGGGLYCGGLHYIEGFANSKNTDTLICFVNPADIISFQSEGHAFRTDALFPYGLWGGSSQMKSVYHSADYDKLSTKRVEKIIADALENEVDLIKKQRSNKGGKKATLDSLS